jgi:DNA polymerase-1
MQPQRSATRLEYVTIRDMDTLKDVIKRAYRAGGFCVDTETTGLNVMQDTLVGIALAVEPYQGYYIPLAHAEGEQLSMDEVLAELKPALEDPCLLKILHNAKFDKQILMRYGITLTGIEDSMLISYAMHGGKHRHNMDDLAWLHLKHRTTKFKEVAGDGTFDLVPIEAATHYAAEDADVTLRLYHVLVDMLAKDPEAMHVYANIDLPLVDVIADMEQAGVAVDTHRLGELTALYQKEVDAALDEIEAILGHEMNPASPRQVAAALEELRVYINELTASGQTATGKDVLEDLLKDDTVNAEGKTLIKAILRWRKFSKLISTYTDALPKCVDPDTGRIHPSFGMAHTNTGRLACSEPNLQNQPSPNKDPVTGTQIRSAFIPEPGNVLIAADYSQIELRVLAQACGDPALLQAFTDGVDIHKVTAAKVLNKPVDQVTSVDRRNAKAVNFGIVYGTTEYGLADTLGITPEAAKLVIEEYFRAFPGIRDYMDNAIAYARQNGYVTTMAGRTIWLQDINSGQKWKRQHAERQAVNAPIQGTAADVIREAMRKVDYGLLEQGFKTRLLLQVHDELVLEAPADEVEAVLPFVKKLMETAVDYMDVKLEVDAASGNSWAEAH